MRKSINSKSNQPPVRYFLTLGWRLALLTTLIIGLVMGGISFNQQLTIDERIRGNQHKTAKK